jgi:benzaldehyde dehydrogenase (NAD)
VLGDVDVDKATSVGAFGSFIHHGQICMSTSRHLVHNSVAKEYASALAARAEHLPVGDPFTGQVALGPMIDERQRDNVHRIVTGSVDAGAALLTGGTYEGLFYRPTVLADVPTSAPAYAEEIFGPVVTVTPFADEAEAIALANDTPYGLSGSIWTGNVGRAIRVARGVETGNLSVNSHSSVRYWTPFGGFKQSGLGRELGPDAVDAFTDVKNVFISTD